MVTNILHFLQFSAKQVLAELHRTKQGLSRVESKRCQKIYGYNLEAGDMVRADALLLESKELNIQQAALTGNLEVVRTNFLKTHRV